MDGNYSIHLLSLLPGNCNKYLPRCTNKNGFLLLNFDLQKCLTQTVGTTLSKTLVAYQC